MGGRLIDELPKTFEELSEERREECLEKKLCYCCGPPEKPPYKPAYTRLKHLYCKKHCKIMKEGTNPFMDYNKEWQEQYLSNKRKERLDYYLPEFGDTNDK